MLSRELADMGELLEMAEGEGDSTVIAEVGGQVDGLSQRVRELELERMLSGTHDRADAIVSIAPGAGGVDAQDWAEMLMRMYLRWCERKGFKAEIVNVQAGDEAGIKDASFTVQGAHAYGFLRAENGVHRLIRISPFDANARRHTAFAAVFVVPDLGEDDDDIEIKPEDLKVDVYRSSGAGGQHVNKTESAVRLTHIPSGIVVACQQERSQHKNRSTAMKMLKAALYAHALAEKEKEKAALEATKTDIGFGHQIRSYVFQPYTMANDHRTELKVTDVHRVMDGDLDPFIEAYLKKFGAGAAGVSP